MVSLRTFGSSAVFQQSTSASGSTSTRGSKLKWPAQLEDEHVWSGERTRSGKHGGGGVVGNGTRLFLGGYGRTICPARRVLAPNTSHAGLSECRRVIVPVYLTFKWAGVTSWYILIFMTASSSQSSGVQGLGVGELAGVELLGLG